MDFKNLIWNWLFIDKQAELDRLNIALTFSSSRIEYLEQELKTTALLLSRYAGLPKFEGCPVELEESTSVYRGMRHLVANGQIYSYKLRLNEYFIPTSKLDWFLTLYKIKEEPDDFEKFKLSLKAVQEKLVYKTDGNQYGQEENFSFSFEVSETKKDDCESLSLTILDIYLRANGNPNKIYWCMGKFNGFGHSWVAFRESEDTWFIGEATRGVWTPPVNWAIVDNVYVPCWGLGSPYGEFIFKNWEEMFL